MFLAGIGIFALSMWSAIVIMGGQLSDYFRYPYPELLIILLPLVGVLAATCSFDVFYRGLRAVVFPKEEISEVLRGQAATLFRFLSKITMLAMLAGFLVGLINMLLHLALNHPWGIMFIGTNIAFVLTTLFHGIFWIAAVFEPAVFILKKRQTKERR
ncbi:MAG: hypothetical protein FWE32_12175 [Oscillospiraceae bacterium]|nr:hypothetical protein [Oscillospiraceae bacterium]